MGSDSTGKKERGPVYGSSKAPLVSSAGKDHVIFSKKLLLTIGLVLLVTVFVYFSVEQSLIAGNLAASRQALTQNNAIRTSNEELEEAKAELQDEEDELVNMYSKWLDEDNEELDISTEELETLKAQLKDMQDSMQRVTSSHEAKEASLAEKEKR